MRRTITLARLAERLPGLRIVEGSEVPYNPNVWAWGPDALQIAWDVGGG